MVCLPIGGMGAIPFALVGVVEGLGLLGPGAVTGGG